MTAAGPPVLSTRELNRALLARQLLLERAELPAEHAVAHLVGLQAQTPRSPYLALWSRLAGFDPGELGGLMTDRRVVRIVLMRSTIHLVTADDCLYLRPLLGPFLAQGLARSQWGRGLDGLDVAAVAAAGREVVEAEPCTFAVLGRRLAERWPDRDPATLAQVVRAHVPLVQVTPRGVWGRSGVATHTSAEHWLGRPPVAGARLDEMVLRYLAAFGPASVLDVQAWCGLTRLAEVVDGLGDRVVRFRSEAGRDLFDVPDGPRPGPDVAAPVRFLPDYDNVLLGHADRTRVVDDDVRRQFHTANGVIPGAVLVDGRVAGKWSITGATLDVTPLAGALGLGDRAAVEAEGTRLLALLAPDAGDPAVRIAAAG